MASSVSTGSDSSDLDKINYYSGDLSFTLSLLTLSGRGGAHHTLTLPISQRWTVNHSLIDAYNEIFAHNATSEWWSDFENTPYSPGRLIGRQSNNGGCSEPGAQVTSTMTRLTFIGPDGSELDFRDTLNNGVDLTGYCTGGGYGASRGTVFVTFDGSAATFISDATIYDEVALNGWKIYPSGHLLFRDGMRYRIYKGKVMWMRDRNGNQITFTYDLPEQPSGRLIKITDSLDREVNINGAEITYKGFGGAETRTIRVEYAELRNALRDDPNGYTLKTMTQLFGLDNGNYTYNPSVVSSVVLPDGVRRYRFYYNSYGELARVELPTGGAFEYDWGASLAGGAGSGVVTVQTTANGATRAFPEIYRRVLARRVMSATNAVEGITTYSQTQGQGTATSVVTVDHKKPDGQTLLSSEKHYFYGNPIPLGEANPLGAESWKAGREYQTEVFDSSGQTLLRGVAYKWEKIHGNPVVTEAVTTLGDTNQVTKQSSVDPQTAEVKFDQYNNPTDVWEYDYGVGAPGPLMRHTHTDYVTDASYTSHTGAHVRNLTRAQQVYGYNLPTGVKTLITDSETRYDEYPLTPYNSVSGWAAPNASARGNPTTKRQWLDTSSQWIEIRTYYDQVGNILSATDAKGNTSTVSYEDSFSDSSNRNTYAYPTRTTSAVPDPNNTGFGSTTALTTSAVYDFSTGAATSITDANGKVVSQQYNDPFNRLTRIDRPDGGWTTHQYDRSINAGVSCDYVRTVISTNSAQSIESYQFFDGLGRPTRTFLNDGGSPIFITADTQYDAAGRVWRVSAPYRTTGSNYPVNPSGIWTKTEYDGLGRAKTVTTHDGAEFKTDYHGARALVTDQSGKQRLTRADALGRPVEVWEVRSSDPASGTESITFPSRPGVPTVAAGYKTTYEYDVLSNLRKVTQGSQQRFFMYDSLGRLIRVRNPEQGTHSRLSYTNAVNDTLTGNIQWSVAYGYDANGNLTSRVDARNVETIYGYDSLNRNTTISYLTDPQNTPSVENHYDYAENGRGRFWYNVTDGATGTHRAVDSYDVMGRPRVQRQLFATTGDMGGGVYWRNRWWSPPYKVTRSYDKAGNTTSQVYPSGHAISYSYDAAGRLADFGGVAGFSGNLGDGVTRTYASQIAYDEAGRMREERFGARTPLYHKLHYNVRGQLFDVRLSTHSWALDPAKEWEWNRGALINYYGGAPHGQSSALNNGNVTRQQHWVPRDDSVSDTNAAEQNYIYDALNRLASVTEVKRDCETCSWVTTGAQHYDYDRFGNRTINAGPTYGVGIPTPGFEVQTEANRLYSPGDIAMTDDGQRRMRYDAAGNLIKDTYTGGGARDYDAENRMTSAWGYSGLTGGPFQNQYTYDSTGQRVRRKTDAGEVWQVYGFDGELLAEYQAGAATILATKEYGYRGGELLVTAASGDDGRMFRFLHKLYNALGRSPSAAEQQQGMAALTAAAAQGQPQLLQASRNLAAALFNSGEYAWRGRTDAQFVTDLYWTYPQRQPDAGGYQAWLNAVTLYGRPATLDGFAYSPEFDALVGRVYGVSGSEDQRTELFVHKLYSALARDASGAELSARVTRINNAAAQDRAQTVAEARAIGRELFQSQEYADRARSDRDFVRDLYVAFLDREPEQGGWDAWTNAAALYGRPAVLNGISDSGEFDNRASTLYREVFWLIADQLGTPRMIADRSGTLTGIKRHDYLPFGEEIGVGTGGRTTAQGYDQVDNVRQHFAGYERDVETSLDFAEARYFSSVQGRFTSVDPLIASARRQTPQSWNRYTYGINNPLKYVDPSGELWYLDANGMINFNQDVKNKKDLLRVCGTGCTLISPQDQYVVHKSNDPRFIEGHVYTFGEGPTDILNHGLYTPPVRTYRLSHERANQIFWMLAKLNGGAIYAGATGGTGAVPMLLGSAGIISEFAFSEDAPDEATMSMGAAYTVYVSYHADGKTLEYVGITNDFQRRAGEHLRETGRVITPLKDGVTPEVAHAIEQSVIDRDGLKKHGGSLSNKINSISPGKRERFKEAFKAARKILRRGR